MRRTLQASVCLDLRVFSDRDLRMEKMNQAMERVKILVGMEVDEEAADESSMSFMDDFNRNCTLSTQQVPIFFPVSVKSIF